MNLANWQHYIPSTHLLIWVYAGIIVTWKLTPFLRAMREACSEKPTNGSKGKVSLKRIVPIIFTLLVCYMVVGSMHSGKPFNETAFWGLMFFIALGTTVITVTQASGFIDKISAFKGNILKTNTEEVSTKKSSTEVAQVQENQ